MTELADIGSLKAFVAVAETESFVTAARAVGLTRSAVGKSIIRLEELLGVRLLHRTTRSVGLTVEGRSFYERAISILSDLEEAQLAVRQGYENPTGKLRLTTTETFGRQIIVPLLNDYMDRWPDMQVEASFTDRFVNIVEEGFDLAIRFGPPPANSELICRVIARSSAVLCASPAYLERHGTPATIPDLAFHRKLVFGSHLRPATWELAQKGQPPEIVSGWCALLSDNAAALRDAAVAGLGITCLPRFVIQKDVEENRLKAVLPLYATAEIPISAVYPNKRHLAARVSVFTNLLAGHLRTLPL